MAGLRGGVAEGQPDRARPDDRAVWVPATLEAPGRVTVRDPVRLVTERSAAGQRLADALDGSFATVEQTDDLDAELWHKLTVNAVAGLLALTGTTGNAVFRRPDSGVVALDLARECVAVAQAAGVALDDGLAEQVIAYLSAMAPEATTSIAVDRADGRELEWDARNGVGSRLGRAHGVPTPVSDVVSALLACASDAAARCRVTRTLFVRTVVSRFAPWQPTGSSRSTA